MDYIDPRTVLTPRGTITELAVIYDGGEHGWSLARMKWEGDPIIAMRWNGGRPKQIPPSNKPSIGTPQSRGYPTWFVLPKEVGEMIENSLRLQKKIST